MARFCMGGKRGIGKVELAAPADGVVYCKLTEPLIPARRISPRPETWLAQVRGNGNGPSTRERRGCPAEKRPVLTVVKSGHIIGGKNGRNAVQRNKLL